MKIVNKNKFYGKNPVWLIFFSISICYVVLTLISQETIYKSSIYYKSYAEQFNQATIDKLLGIKSSYVWMSYIVIPFTLLLKFTLISVCISIGKVFSEIDLEFKQIFKASMIAEGVFIIAQVTFTIILFLNLDEVTLQNASGYFPLSALSFIGIENVNAQWAIYPLQTANLFEIFYVLSIAFFLSKRSKNDFLEILSIVFPSYMIGLFLWITLVAFLTFQLT